MRTTTDPELPEPAAPVAWIGSGSALGVPVPVWIFLSMVFVAVYVLRMTPFGWHVYAVGGTIVGAAIAWLVFNPEVAGGIRDLAVGTNVFVLPWLHQVQRDVLADEHDECFRSHDNLWLEG